MREKSDISGNFHFETIERGSYVYKIGSGQLGVPGMVKLHRSKSAQSSVSSGTGDDAGHLIGNRFGAPGGPENLGPQNWIQNQYGTFKQLENTWEARLKQGVAIACWWRTSSGKMPAARKRTARSCGGWSGMKR